MRRRSVVLAAGVAAGTLILLGGCLVMAPPEVDNEAIDAYGKVALENNAEVRFPPVGSEQRTEALARWKELFDDLSASNIEGRVASVYADKVFFNDTLKTLHSASELEAYLLETAEMLHSCTGTFEDVVESENDTYVRWRMVYRSKKLNPKQDIVTIGITHLQFDEQGKVILHQDFWDSTRGIFEHVPGIGTGIRALKKRI